MIVSFTNGRIRARLAHLKGQPAPEIPAGAMKGVRNITVNPVLGSVLLEYDPEAVSVETIASYLEAVDPEGAAALRNPELLKPRSLLGRPVEIPDGLLTEEARRSRPAPPRKRGSPRATAELVNLSLAFLSCVTSAFWGSVRTHAICGAGFGVMLGQHVWTHRRRLRPLSQMSIWEILGLDIPGFLKPGPVECPKEGREEEEAGGQAAPAAAEAVAEGGPAGRNA
ncbi:MAG: hypothetical protein LBP95_08420 [Deltaproteobacteria bacterium]|jgi:hypothetical protein|nr:hypothetical protein [Deltaproteobacteria bacterium]